MMMWQLQFGMAGSDPKAWTLDPTVVEADSEKHAVDKYYKLKIAPLARQARPGWVLRNVRRVVVVKTK
jgi:hypothetical protein